MRKRDEIEVAQRGRNKSERFRDDLAEAESVQRGQSSGPGIEGGRKRTIKHVLPLVSQRTNIIFHRGCTRLGAQGEA